MNNKELDEYKTRQEIENAAKLKAKLDMVEVRDKARYGRAPRKIGVLTCSTGIKTGHRTAEMTFTLRLDGDGTFIAEHGDVWYCSFSRAALKAKMDQVALVTIDLKWTRYLLVRYETLVTSDRWGGTSHLNLGDRRDKKAAVLGMTLQWEIVEYSDAIDLPGQGQRFMKREVDDDGKPSSSQTTEAKLPDGIVPYTKEREEMLKQLRAALTDVDAKMTELFRGVPDHVGRRLDLLKTSGSTLLLAAPKPAKPKGKAAQNEVDNVNRKR